MKKKILALCLCVVLAVTAVTGATLAYFSDTDAEKNTFTVGKIDIDLVEDFTQGSELNPGTKDQNNVEKEVWVELEKDSKDAYVRVHIAIPTAIDDGDPTFAAVNNALHFNFSKESVADGKWSWKANYSTGNGYNAKDWNFYTTEINGVGYNVYVVTYRTALSNDEGGITKTENAMDQVYLDKSIDYVTEETVEDETYTGYTQVVNGKVKKLDLSNTSIFVVAEGTQTDGFSNAYDALNTAFGKPGTYTVKWTADNEQDVIVDNDK